MGHVTVVKTESKGKAFKRMRIQLEDSIQPAEDAPQCQEDEVGTTPPAVSINRSCAGIVDRPNAK